MRKRLTSIAGWAGVWLAIALVPVAWGAWDSTKPATGTLLNSSEIRSNFQALEQSALAENLVEDPTFQIWPSGASSAPWGWTLSGAGAAVARETAGANLNGLGPYAVKVTFGSVAAVLERQVFSSASFLTYYRSRTFSAAIAVKASAASQARIEINDGIGSTFSSYHTGGGTYEWLTVTRTMDPAATVLNVRIRNEVSGSVYAQGVNVSSGPIPGAAFVAKRNVYDGRQLLRSPIGLLEDRLTTYGLSGVVDSQFSVAGIGNSAGVETTLFTFPLAASALGANGAVLRVSFSLNMANTANAKTVKAYIGASSVLCLNANAVQNLLFRGVVDIQRTGAAAEFLSCAMTSQSNVNAATTNFGSQTTAAENTANALTVQVTGSGAGASDVVGYSMISELLNKPF